jgi:hypothetical protein
MYNHLPRVDPTRSLDGGHRAPESERAALRRLHREHVGAERARGAQQPPAIPLTTRLFTLPTAALQYLRGQLGPSGILRR